MKSLPALPRELYGKSAVKWRYHFNTVTFSYTAAFWDWEDWELQLDWMALHGVNLPLAWVGQEKILLDTFREFGFSDDEVFSYFSGPAFQAWQRFGNIQGSWGGRLPMDWIDRQFELQKKIVKRMTELGMTPVLPAFTGYVPRAAPRVLAGAKIINGSQWDHFSSAYTNVTFLEPEDPLFAKIQKHFIEKQRKTYGNVSNIYTLDQFNENNPSSGDENYLREVGHKVKDSLKSADPNAVWMMQGWLFYSNREFWTNERAGAYLSGIENPGDMLILDLWSESEPQWQRTKSYWGKNWIWCQLHDYGQNMGMYGQIENVTVSSMQALNESKGLVGFGLTPEGQEGNEIVYDLLLDQAWNPVPIDAAAYIKPWVKARYAGSPIPQPLFGAWDILRTTVYNNTNLTQTEAVPRSIAELEPKLSGLTDQRGDHPTTLSYNPKVIDKVLTLFVEAANQEPSLWSNPGFEYDLVDVTRQALANAFIPAYQDLIHKYNTTHSPDKLRNAGLKLQVILHLADAVLSTNKHFRLDTWIDAAKTWAHGNSSLEQFYEYDAKNQVTLWGPNGEIDDYASKSWGGLVSGYYAKRWDIFVQYLVETPPAKYEPEEISKKLVAFGKSWQSSGEDENKKAEKPLKELVAQVQKELNIMQA